MQLATRPGIALPWPTLEDGGFFRELPQNAVSLGVLEPPLGFPNRGAATNFLVLNSGPGSRYVQSCRDATDYMKAHGPSAGAIRNVVPKGFCTPGGVVLDQLGSPRLVSGDVNQHCKRVDVHVSTALKCALPPRENGAWVAVGGISGLPL